ncbi:MAG: adenine phosphoribosyltransferase [Coprobacillus sp.]|nr:adenine phosphoribosyltransferase [Coprobacillus sp.]MDY4145012.1 adenine phosphoribosyltransferase [Bacilli bacterium]CCY06932.1 adenine phosphoribosyltransferase [Coprobacillus sp. CAG:698]
MDYKKYIATVKDFPTKGIMFRDTTPLMANGEAFRCACEELEEFAKECGATLIAGPEARGFIFGCPIAKDLGVGYVPIRKPNKLPRETVDVSYSLEYGTNTLCIHKDAVKKGDKVFIVDDLLATGGTVKAAIDLVEKLGGEVVGLGFLIELVDLKGRKLLEGYKIKVLMEY